MLLALISALIYLVNRGIMIPGDHVPAFFRDYLGDILALPIYLPLSFYLSLRLDIVPENFQFSHLHILGAVILFSIIFEGIIPAIDQSSTRDPLDILAYLLGGFIVYVVNIYGQQGVGKE